MIKNKKDCGCTYFDSTEINVVRRSFGLDDVEVIKYCVACLHEKIKKEGK